jgi:hypothetical protein
MFCRNTMFPRLKAISDLEPVVVTQVCGLRFPDGATVLAQIKAETPYEDAPIEYSGPVERLPVKPGLASSVLLRALFQSFARELDAGFQEELIGSWDRFAEEEDEPSEEEEADAERPAP